MSIQDPSKASASTRLTKFVTYSLGAWAAMAFLGYGVALKMYADSERKLTVGQFGGNYRVIEGAIADIHMPFLGLGDPEFTLKGQAGTYVVPKEFISPGLKLEINRILTPGTPVWLAFRLRGNWAVQLDANPRTSRVQSLVNPTNAQKMIEPHLQSVAERGSTFIFFGMGILPVSFLLTWYLRKLFVRPVA
jgi:hypothetical protein